MSPYSNDATDMAVLIAIGSLYEKAEPPFSVQAIENELKSIPYLRIERGRLFKILHSFVKKGYVKLAKQEGTIQVYPASYLLLNVIPATEESFVPKTPQGEVSPKLARKVAHQWYYGLDTGSVDTINVARQKLQSRTKYNLDYLELSGFKFDEGAVGRRLPSGNISYIVRGSDPGGETVYYVREENQGGIGTTYLDTPNGRVELVDIMALTSGSPRTGYTINDFDRKYMYKSPRTARAAWDRYLQMFCGIDPKSIPPYEGNVPSIVGGPL